MALILILAMTAPVAAATDDQAIRSRAPGSSPVEAGGPRAALQSPGISARFEGAVPSQVRAAVNDVLAEFAAVLVFPAGSVQIAVSWQPQGSLGVGGPVLVHRGDQYFPAAVADVRFGGHHAQGPVDGFVSMGSNHPWYFGSDENVPANLFDFRSAFAHELVHSLGFTVDTRLTGAGHRVLSGRTAVFDRYLYSGGARLVNLTAAQQSAAFGRDDVWCDVGGGRLVPLNTDGGRGASHFGNAHSATDTEPGALMYAGLINGTRHHLDSLVIGALSGLGFATIGAPAPPVNARVEGATLRWSTNPRVAAPPAETIRIIARRSGAVVSSVDLPGAVEQYVLPAAARNADIDLVLIDRSGRATSMFIAGAPPLMGQASSLPELINAPDYRADFGDVLRLYWAFFNREPDVGGAKYWIGLYKAGVSLDAIAGAFAGSAEFRLRYGNLTGNDEYLSVIYRNVLRRERDNSGFVYWLGLLNQGALSRGAVVRWIAAAPEFIGAHPY